MNRGSGNKTQRLYTCRSTYVLSTSLWLMRSMISGEGRAQIPEFTRYNR